MLGEKLWSYVALILKQINLKELYNNRDKYFETDEYELISTEAWQIYNVFSKEYSYYIRKMSSTVKATETEQKELYDMARTIPFDDRMNHEAEIRDLKLPLIQNYLYEIKSALTYIQNTVIVEKILKIDGQAEAVRFLNYPYQAIEEALVNAVYHRRI